MLFRLLKWRQMKYRVVLVQDEDGVYIATCSTLPGCVSQGETRQEALQNIREAIELYVESLQKHGDAVPSGIDEEIVEIAGG
jgi:predicted RNase H-like HicB family nuclease